MLSGKTCARFWVQYQQCKNKIKINLKLPTEILPKKPEMLAHNQHQEGKGRQIS